eukprot:jgi/Mesen1/9749/ME000698S09227
MGKRGREEGSDSGGDEPTPPPRMMPKTIENTREKDETLVDGDDIELRNDNAQDEFSEHFSRQRTPLLMYRYVQELLTIIPAAHFYERGPYHIKQIVQYATNRDFTGVIVVNENHKRPNGMLVINLPEGPTAHFKISNLVLSKRIKKHGTPSSHKPELILNNFNTRLGHRVGRLLASLFPQDPQFRGRRCVTFHNQRDYIFFRHHRYVFETRDSKAAAPPPKKKKKKAAASGGGDADEEEGVPQEVISRLQECGPRFTLKLQSLQHGTFDSKGGEYEWVHKADMDTSRRRFFL